MSGQFSKCLTDLWKDFRRTSVFTLNTGDDCRYVEQFGQLRKRKDCGLQLMKWIGLGEFHNSGLKVGEEDNGILRIDAVIGAINCHIFPHVFGCSSQSGACTGTCQRTHSTMKRTLGCINDSMLTPIETLILPLRTGRKLRAFQYTSTYSIGKESD